MQIPSLNSFDSSDWDSINAAFQNAPTLAFRQAWLEAPLKEFRPGEVLLGWQADSLLVLARLEDDCLFTRMTADNQEAWCLGDVFELFLKDATRENYLELHIAPSGHRLQLHFPDANAILRLRDKEIKLTEYYVTDSLFDFAVRPVPTGWEVFVRLPAASLGSQATDLQGTEILASFSRYDYDDQGSEPVLSSTSPHEIANFHRQQEWRSLTLV